MSGTLALILSITSGFALLGYHLSPLSMIATSLIVDAALAPITAVVAYQHKRSLAAWAVLGFVLGMWTLAAILLLVQLRRAPSNADAPIHPDAA